MTTETATFDLTEPDVRVVPCRQKHAMILSRWAELPIGDHLVLINDHDPVPLYYQFASMFPDAFTWEYEVPGPDEYRVRLTRVAASSTTPVVRPPDMRPGPTSEEATLDVRGLEPPEPMIRILNATETLQEGGRLRAHTERRPIHLYAELTRRGLKHVSEDQSDGSCITMISRP